MSSQNNLDKIENIVVLMLENRSFDNILGFLYPDNPDFRGVNDAMCNPAPDNQGSVCVRKGDDMIAPYPDPHEKYEFIYRQLFNEPPTMPVPNTTDTPAMQGFVIDYADAIKVANDKAEKDDKPPFDTVYDVIMNCFAPESLPVINGLAQAYAVCDNWFSSVPTQTFPNRSFVHAATSSGNVYNMWKGKHFWEDGIFINDTPTIYDLLEDGGGQADWRIYYGSYRILCNALLIQKHLWKYVFDEDRLAPFERFKTDIESGKLPSYSFIEPRMLYSRKYGPENDMHPAYAMFDHGPPTNVLDGEKLIYEVYTALRSNDEIWNKTLLVITFDEHGGCYDHVPPPAPVSAPDDKIIPFGKPGGNGFDFERLGVRVPAILVSPWIEKGTICHTQFDHTSIIKTVSNKWLNGQHLTQRDLNATDVSEILSRSTPRTDTPEINPITPLTPLIKADDDPLSPLQREMVKAMTLLAGYLTHKIIDPDLLNTKGDVETAIESLEAEIFG